MVADSKILKKIAIRNFTWSDVYKEDIESVNANIFCMFHENTRTPSARLYYNADDDYYFLYCYTEKKAFTVYDYINLILVEKYQQFKSVEDYLIQNLGEIEYRTQYAELEGIQTENFDNAMNLKIEYIDNVYNDTLNLFDYIEELYTA